MLSMSKFVNKEDYYKARINELEKRLEISDKHPYDGIYTRNCTINDLDAVIEAQKRIIDKLREDLTEAANDLFVYTTNPKTAEFLRDKYRALVKDAGGNNNATTK